MWLAARARAIPSAGRGGPTKLVGPVGWVSKRLAQAYLINIISILGMAYWTMPAGAKPRGTVASGRTT